MKKLDILLIGLYLCLSIAAAIYFTIDGLKVHDGEQEVVISVQNEEYKRIPLPTDKKIQIIIETDLGRNLVEIEGNRVWMNSADCDDQLCVHQKEITHSKEMIVCLPNEVLIEIKGKDKVTVDQIAQ